MSLSQTRQTVIKTAQTQTVVYAVQVLLNNRPEATTALLMQLCTPGDASKPDGDWVAKVSDFAHLAADRYALITPHTQIFHRALSNCWFATDAA